MEDEEQQNEETPLIRPAETQHGADGVSPRKLRVRERLESPWTHRFIISLTVIDAICVISEIAYDLLTLEKHCRCPDGGGTPERHDMKEPLPIEILSRISLGITAVFVLEILFTVYAFGFSHYIPWRVEHGFLHFLDATVILTTFVLELILPPSLSSITSLLILLRLWRIVKLVSGVSMAVNDLGDEGKERQILELKREIEVLKAKNNNGGQVTVTAPA
ncbi:hypothetical protein BT69DRAFT_1279635 [Atractiella rhizophila]|nr:hypothetical protein BT69DRAFT_1282936 [Atractiella rhizophila]KAH8925495.1 hypothetical protein BT69DRAFT_1279635 [Atractiella rhizophila]